jgi:gamma-glutamylcyclotransferase (GGCT)/AIG2-like uncharacterized protein YtfP
MEPEMPTLFVYGTLKSDQRRNFYLTREGARLLGVARTAPRYRLLRPLLCDYPCLVEETKKGVCVEGELWEVSAACLDVCDSVEGVPHLFVRRLVDLENGEQAEAYFIRNRPFFAWNVGSRWP